MMISGMLHKSSNHRITINSRYPDNMVETLLRHFRRLNQGGQVHKAVGILGYKINPDLSWGASMESPNWYTWSEFEYYYIRGWRIAKEFRVGIITGGGGVTIDSSWFKDSDIDMIDAAPEEAMIVDDIWLNGHMAKVGIER